MDDMFSHDSDFLVWTERQARVLRDLASRRADLPNELDIENLAEEIEDLGRSEFNAFKSHIRNIMLHLIKAACEPDARAVPHWSSEARAFHWSMLDKHSPSMPSRIDLATLWAQAREGALEDLAEIRGASACEIPAICPFGIEDFIAKKFDFRALLARLAPPA